MGYGEWTHPAKRLVFRFFTRLDLQRRDSLLFARVLDAFLLKAMDLRNYTAGPPGGQVYSDVELAWHVLEHWAEHGWNAVPERYRWFDEKAFNNAIDHDFHAVDRLMSSLDSVITAIR